MSLQTLQQGPRRRGPMLILGLGIAAVMLLAGMRLSARLAPPEVLPVPPLLVETLELEPRPFVLQMRYSGSVEAERRATLAARLSSSVLEREVSEGTMVVKGQRLMRLDDTEQRQELQRLKAAADRIGADLDYWQKQLRVDQRLFREGSITERSFQETRRQVETLRASQAENRHAQATAMTRLGYAEIHAPFDGVVQTIPVQVGETVAPGKALLELVSLESLKAVISAPQSDRKQLHLGLAVQLHIPHLERTWSGAVDRIRPALDERSRNVTLEVFLPRRPGVGVYPGMSVEAVLELARHHEALSLPLHALQQRGGEQGVYLRKGELAEWRTVETGAAQDGWARVLDGLAAGDEVITTPYPALQPGSRVEVAGGSAS